MTGIEFSFSFVLLLHQVELNRVDYDRNRVLAAVLVFMCQVELNRVDMTE